jgi:hypothetical protein
VARERAISLGRSGIGDGPEPHDAVSAPAGEARGVWREREGVDRARRQREPAAQSPVDAEDRDVSLPRRRGEQRAVLRERDGPGLGEAAGPPRDARRGRPQGPDLDLSARRDHRQALAAGDAAGDLADRRSPPPAALPHEGALRGHGERAPRGHGHAANGARVGDQRVALRHGVARGHERREQRGRWGAVLPPRLGERADHGAEPLSTAQRLGGEAGGAAGPLHRGALDVLTPRGALDVDEA